MLDKIKTIIKKCNLIEKNDKIVVAVSGGADSITLLHVLYALKQEYNLELFVVHLNHLLRGEDSDGDADYVKEISDSLDIKSFIYSEDINEYSKKNKMSFEEAAREVRYKLFDEVLEHTKSNKIAVAQNKNDQAETILMRLARGAGLEGLTSIKNSRDNIIRPLLSISRDEIDNYCRDNKLKFRTDKTNFETIYTRNKIRLELIPYLQENFNSNIVDTLYSTTELLSVDLDFISQEVIKMYNEIVKKFDGILSIDIKLFNDIHISISSRIIRKIIENINGDIKGVSSNQIYEIIELCKDNHHGSYKIIKKYIKFEVSYNKLKIFDIRNLKDGFDKVEFDIENGFEYNGYFLSVIDDEKNSITFDKDKIKGKLYIRTRKPGDRFKPLGMNGSKKLKDFFIDSKISSSKRNNILLLCDNDSIIWVVGIRMSEEYKITDKTKNKINFSYKKLDQN